MIEADAWWIPGVLVMVGLLLVYLNETSKSGENIMSNCNRSVEVRAWAIVLALIVVTVLGSCFATKAKAGEFSVQLGTNIIHRDFYEPYLALGYRADNGLGGSIAGWKYVEPATYNSPYVIYDPACTSMPSCPVIDSGTTPLPSSVTRWIGAGWFDYEFRYGIFGAAFGAGYLSRATDVEDRRAVPTAALTWKPRGTPCGLTLRALGRWGLVGAQCGF